GNRFRRQGRYLADSRADLCPTAFPVVKLRRAQRIARTDPGYLISPSACIAALTAGRAATRSWKLCRFANLARSTLTTLAQLVTVKRYASAMVNLSPNRYCRPCSF